MLRGVQLILVGFLLAGCATIINHPSQKVAVLTDPPGATCTFMRDGELVGIVKVTPGNLRLHRGSEDIDVTCTESGYKDANATETSHFTATTFGNVVAGGLIGVVVDASTGANFDYIEEIHLAMTQAPDTVVAVPDHARCPQSGMQAGRTDATIVNYAGPDPAIPDACLTTITPQHTASWYFSLVSAEGPDAAAADAALKTVVYGPPNATAHYTIGAGADQWVVDVTMAEPDAVVLNDKLILARRMVFHKRKPSAGIEGDDTYWLDPIDGMPIKRTWVQTHGAKTTDQDWTVGTLRKL